MSDADEKLTEAYNRIAALRDRLAAVEAENRMLTVANEHLRSGPMFTIWEATQRTLAAEAEREQLRLAVADAQKRLRIVKSIVDDRRTHGVVEQVTIMQTNLAAALAGPVGVPAEQPEPSDYHRIEHERYGTWPCAWQKSGFEGCPVWAELAAVAEPLVADPPATTAESEAVLCSAKFGIHGIGYVDYPDDYPNPPYVCNLRAGHGGNHAHLASSATADPQED